MDLTFQEMEEKLEKILRKYLPDRDRFRLNVYEHEYSEEGLLCFDIEDTRNGYMVKCSNSMFAMDLCRNVDSYLDILVHGRVNMLLDFIGEPHIMSNEKEKIIIENLENLTLDQAVEYHRILWRGIAEELSATSIPSDRILPVLKSNVILKNFYILDQKGHPKNGCFLCEYSGSRTDGLGCYYCPLFQRTSQDKRCLNGLYVEFIHHLFLDRFSKAKKIALEIAELPIVNRKGEE